MDLRTWIDTTGSVEEAARLLDEKPRTVGSWYRAEKAPRMPAAIRIVAATNGLVDFNGIYGPIARAMASRQAQGATC
ncbi:MAG: hypothetical protein LPH21_07430 [Shewanella sp.]|nr:hypothetical protein [Shewanella sp.]